jgi:hypothetical protein
MGSYMTMDRTVTLVWLYIDIPCPCRRSPFRGFPDTPTAAQGALRRLVEAERGLTGSVAPRRSRLEPRAGHTADAGRQELREQPVLVFSIEHTAGPRLRSRVLCGESSEGRISSLASWALRARAPLR